MSGKVFAVVVAAAVSSASAATVGVVYKQMVERKPIEASAPMTEMATSAGPVRSAVVLNASDSLFGFLAGSMTEGDSPADTAGESDSTVCRAGARCVVVARASDRRVNILGSAAAIPPFWLGGDSRDVYADRAAQGVLSFDEGARIVVHLARRRLKTGTLGFDPQSDDGSAQTGTQEPSGPGPANLSSTFNAGASSPTTSGASSPTPSGASSPTTSGAGLGYPIEIEVQTPPLAPEIPPPVDNVSSLDNLLTALSPIDTASNPPPTFDLSSNPQPWQTPATPDIPATTVPTVTIPYYVPTSGGTAPEPSTWVMTIIGFATLGLFKRQRLAAALKAMRG